MYGALQKLTPVSTSGRHEFQLQGRTYDDTLCDGYYYGSGSLGLRLCICTSWRDEHRPRSLTWHDVSARGGPRFAGRAS